MVTTDTNKMHQNVAFPGIKIPKFSPHTSPQFFEEFSQFNHRLSFVCGGILTKTLIITVLSVFWLLRYNY